MFDDLYTLDDIQDVLQKGKNHTGEDIYIDITKLEKYIKPEIEIIDHDDNSKKTVTKYGFKKCERTTENQNQFTEEDIETSICPDIPD